MIFLKQFETHADYQAFTATEEFVKPNVSVCENEDETHYNPLTNADKYLTFVIKTGGNIKFSGSSAYTTVSYSKDNGGTWTTANSATVISVVAGDKIMWRGNCSPASKKGIGRFSGDTNVRYDVEGNVMSLLYRDSFKGKTDLTGSKWAFTYLFSGNKNVVKCENLSLPATTLSVSAYTGMFQGCTNLTTAPELPATTLDVCCYKWMFSGCTSLTKAPSSIGESTTVMVLSGCAEMFVSCSGLTTTPELPATTLASNCYRSMFDGCKGLTTAHDLPAETVADGCYYYMFAGCTSLTTAPNLPATTLATQCYNGMFYRCTSLNSITCLATNISASLCTSNWVWNVASNGTFTKAASMSSWTTGVDGIPNGWTVQNA